MNYETPVVSAELVNGAFFDKIFSAGQVKQAEEAASLYVRERLYEDGILRRLFEPRIVTADELDPAPETGDQPAIICEIEPKATKATFVPYKGTGERRYYEGRRFRVPFGKIEAERITKSKFELMTIRMPIQQWLQENQVKAIQHEEDKLFIDTINEICQDNSAQQEITFDLSTGSFKDAIAAGKQALIRMDLPDTGKILMHTNTYIESLKLKVDEIGFRPQEARFDRGVTGEDSFMGYPVVKTIKSDIVPEGVIYFFAPQEFFCKNMLLQDATLYMKTEADMITFHTYEAPGFAVGNTRGVVKMTLE